VSEPAPLYVALAGGYDPLDALLLVDQARPAWHARAACRGAGVDTFFPAHGNDGPAREVCDSCPVVEDCRAWAEEHKPADGVWAGDYRGPRPRSAAARRRGPVVTDEELLAAVAAYQAAVDRGELFPTTEAGASLGLSTRQLRYRLDQARARHDTPT